MSFDTDMTKARAVLAEMDGNFRVANPMVGNATNTEADNWQNEVRREIAGPHATLLVVNKVAINAHFYEKYGKLITEKIKNNRMPTYLKCFDFNAYVGNKLIEKGFEGSIKKGLIGISTIAGHEFLVLYHQCPGYERYLDIWSHIQTNQGALCEPKDFGDLVPPKLRSALTDKGVKVSTELKSGTCP